METILLAASVAIIAGVILPLRYILILGGLLSALTQLVQGV